MDSPSAFENRQIDAIVRYIEEQNLYFGADRRRPSWALPLGTHVVPAAIAEVLSAEIPVLLSEFIASALSCLEHAFCELEGGGEGLLRRNVPPEILDLWQHALRVKRLHIPFCVRPDILVDEMGRVNIIEFNIDTRLDRGIAVGVTEYSRLVMDIAQSVVSDSIDIAYAQAAKALSGNQEPRMVIAVSEAIRVDYLYQEQYFARRLQQQGVYCQVRTVPQLAIDDAGFVVDLVDRRRVDVLVPEIELFDIDGGLRFADAQFMRRLVEARTCVIGSVLPFADKLLLALCRGHRSSRATMIAPTAVLTRDSVPDSSVFFNCSQHGQHYVLKRCGSDLASTGSKAVVICSDVSGLAWQSAVVRALSDVDLGRRAWVWQPRLESVRYAIRYRLKPQGVTRLARSLVRLSAYYVNQTPQLDTEGTPQYQLAGALATAGTDEETLKRERYTIHGLRQSTYLAVSTERGN